MKIINDIEAGAKRYAADVLSGKQIACLMVRLACQRWEDDWKREDLYFDHAACKMVSKVCSCIRHYKGEQAGKPFKVEDWQAFILANIFGWKRKDTGYRRYTYADVYVPRKNGKTFLACVIAIILEFFDGESGAEVYAAAVDKEQAKICFDGTKELIKRSEFADYAGIYRNAITYEQTASTFKPLSKDTKNKDGLNPHGAICDERHAWRTNEIYDVIRTGMGARRQPLLFSISTAGVDTNVPYFDDLSAFREILLKIKDKDNHFIMMFEPDDGDDWQSEDTWRKVNPNYGISLSADYMRQEFENARNRGGSAMTSFQTKNLNMWVDAPEVWISDDDVVKCNRPLDRKTLDGKPCYVGIDLASKNDITAVAFFFPEQMAIDYMFFIPEAKVEEQKDRVDYRQWGIDGFVTVTPGKVLDYDYFMQSLLLRLNRYDVKSIAYDPWGMWDKLDDFGKYKPVLMPYNQGIKYMSVPTKWMQEAVLDGKLNFLGNPVIRWMFRNVVIYRDPNDNIKINKGKARNKIDGIVATVDAIGGYLTKTAEDKKVYQTHTLRTIRI